MHTPYEEETLGPLMAQLRKARGLSQGQLADTLCALSGRPTLTRNEVSRWERHERFPSEYWLQYLAQALSVSVQQLRVARVAARCLKQQYLGIARGHGDRGAPPVTSWITLQHGPEEIIIALAGVKLDPLHTLLAPIDSNPAEPATDRPSLVPMPENM